jgi:CDP-glycerol glycerophosphotransferase (TagB/SpsB family)
MWKKIFSFLRFLPVTISSLIPKDKTIWIFGAWFGQRFSDNPKFFYLYVKYKMEKEGIRPIWICKSEELCKSLKKTEIECYTHNSLKGIYFQLRAAWAFYTHSVSADLNPKYVGWNTLRLQMWHGVPLKKIMYDNSMETSWLKKNTIYRYMINIHNDYVLSPYQALNNIFASAFDLPAERVINSGYPRNDVFFVNRTMKKADKKSYKVIYMPTFRQYIDSKNHLFDETYGFDFTLIDNVIKTNGIELTIRVHPANSPCDYLLECIENSANIHLSTADDIYDEIEQYDCLITDYSSIMFDYALTDRPIIFASFDIKQYINSERGMYYLYEDITAGKQVENWTQLLDQLIKYKKNPETYVKSPLLTSLTHTSQKLEEHDSFSKKLFDKIITIH